MVRRVEDTLPSQRVQHLEACSAYCMIWRIIHLRHEWGLPLESSVYMTRGKRDVSMNNMTRVRYYCVWLRV